MELILSQKELFKLCEALDLKNHRGIYLLSGNLASGKTTLVKAMVNALGSKAKVTSPTFLTALEYGNQIYHYDIYNKDLKEIFALGFLEEIEKEGWHFIEWGDENLAKILQQIGLPFCHIIISIESQKRKYNIIQG
ncbi:tRNA (adenosine(37)-N6)-threonylcarbamoyltransferase complex ATPase subunit type 1 TsaE [uncultured Helicobacter sp.]|uniref:tRNA (adenosine(37)-N6)-threonylcarbamoyltransferase complex ATPase subunit type 1 TsaE n=1 Tax=uncultured Helicobacter sp. TaxID=175537 RepID=UPI0026355EC9|nr:tRNA (adenosine(37)-N6)-threonylcarbamoyltransferase complex ATPase subunit type 1 TsaE [uncultured Helicobacter sp.]